MILSCNSCEKKFVVPDNAISTSGRLVQCSACGNKWKQFPIKNVLLKNDQTSNIKITPQRTIKTTKIKKQKIKKKTGPNLYTPEYLSKKHGIKINETTQIKQKKNDNETKINFGFYNFLIVSLITIIFVLRSLYFSQNIISGYFPASEMYINYLFENINNIKEIILNFFVKY